MQNKMLKKISMNPSPYLVRDTIAQDKNLIDFMFNFFDAPDIKNGKEQKVREYILNILFRVYQRHPELKDRVQQVIGAYQKKVEAAMKEFPDRAGSLQNELDLVT